jgi:hypothetical protein
MDEFLQSVIAVHGMVLGLFVCSTGLILGMTCVNRCRIRGVLFSWGRGRLFGLPMLQTLFLVAIVVVLAHALLSGETGRILTPLVLLGYLLAGIFWYVSAVLGETVIVTEYGLVSDVRRLTTSVSWSRVFDYVELPERASGHYAFLYADNSGGRKRVDIYVPHAFRDRFRALIRSKLDARFNYIVDTSRGARELQP